MHLLSYLRKLHPGINQSCLVLFQVYGYSVGFGKADHSKTVDLLKKKYPNYKIDKSDEGY
jgi:hypothetical protein